jgi:hypothetical protein
MQEELTPEQIASMSEVIAEYMGWEILGYYDKITHKRKRIIRVNIYGYWEEYNSLDADWNVLHEVWEKVRYSRIDKAEYHVHCSKIKVVLTDGTKLQTLEALFNAIQFINKLKQTEKKVFSVNDGSLVCSDNIVSMIDTYIRQVIASTYEFTAKDIHLLPSTLIRKQSDEELAEESVKKHGISIDTSIDFLDGYLKGFLAGRKSFGDKEFHLTREELENFGVSLLSIMCNPNGTVPPPDKPKLDITGRINGIINGLFTTPIYPHTIEVMHDGNNYLWETLNAIY